MRRIFAAIAAVLVATGLCTAGRWRRRGAFPNEADKRARKRAADRMVKRLRRGFHLGGLRATREDMHDR